ncbi:hypothetical protein [Bordetella genomosp. 13]|uniref:hypothetical protein n=1 Tax=Bordetella genomosp. 13 TaxID=463040 RepID=UPI0011A924E4|nr:hypothetical protein [Bordetella genomosp. 13]
MAINSLPGNFPRIDSAAIGASGLSEQAVALAVLMDRHTLLQDKANEQARLLQGLNEELRSLGREKALLLGADSPEHDPQRRGAELDSQIAALSSRVSIEMTRLQDLMQVTMQALDAVRSAVKNENGSAGGAIRDLR